MIDPGTWIRLTHPQFDPAAPEGRCPCGAKALPASPGAACAKIVSREDAKEWVRQGEGGSESNTGTSRDIEGMKAQGILTVRGGTPGLSRRCGPRHGQVFASFRARHSVVHGRGEQAVHPGGKTYHEGDWLSLDSSTGSIYDGAMPTVDASVGGDFGHIWHRPISIVSSQVHTNDTPTTPPSP